MKAWIAVTVSLLVSFTTEVSADLPATHLSTASLTSPGTAWSYYGVSTTHTNGIGHTIIRPPEITALARGLGSERVGQPGPVGITSNEYAQRAYDYVRNNIDIEFRFGLSKGARGGLIDQSANAFDQSHLLVELLREAGITAGYRVGTISLTAQEFGLWSGLINNLNPLTQDFDVDARSACQLLADGSIPAVVDEQSDCGSMTGNLPKSGTPIVMGHIWVVANEKVYDPAYKQYRFTGGVDLAAAIGCGNESAPTCGSSIATSAMVGASTGTIGGSPSITNVNEPGLRGNISGKAQNLQSYVEANMVNAQLDELIGGMEINHNFSPTPSGATMFPSTAQYSWSGDIPDQFRTTLRVRYAVFDATFFGDEISGKRLRIFGYPQGDTGWLLYLESLRVITSTCVTCPYVGVTLNIDHPYAANSGTYADGQVDMPLLATPIPNVPPITIVHGFGKASPSTEQFFADLQTVDPSPMFLANGFPKVPWPGFDPFCGGSAVIEGKYYERLEICRNDSQPTFVAKVLAQGGVADRIVSAVSKTHIQRHHTIGMIASQIISPATSDLLSIQSSVSFSHKEGNSVDRKAAFETSSAIWAMLEGSAAQQISDTWMPDSPTGLIAMANEKGVPLVNISAGNMASTLPSLIDYDAGRQARLSALAADGYNVIIPRNATPGTFVFPPGVEIRWLVGGSAFYRDDGLAYMVNEAYKGGAAAVGPDAPDKATLDSARLADYAVNDKEYLSVTPNSGEVSLSPAPDIVTGAGEFPDSLPFERRYRSDSKAAESMSLVYAIGGMSVDFYRFWTYSGPDIDKFAHLGGGWTHNYSISASLDNNAMKAMSKDSALDSSAFIAGLFSLYDAFRVPTFERRLSAIFSAQWLNDRLRHNAVTVDIAGKIEVFARLPDGTFNAPPGSASNLAQGDPPIGPRILNPAWTVGFDYLPVTFAYTDRDGAVIFFNASSLTENDAGAYGRSMFKPVSWTFPGRSWITFDYDLAVSEISLMETGPQWVSVSLLKNVTNHLGRQLNFTNVERVVSANPIRSVWLAQRVTDESSRYIEYDAYGCPDVADWAGPPFPSRALTCYVFTSKTQDDILTGYTYDPYTDSPNPDWIVRPSYRLRRTFVPSELSEPFQTIVYDDLFRAGEVIDALSRSTEYFTGAASLWERYTFSEFIDSEGGLWGNIHNQRGNLLQATDPLGRITFHEYDDVGRLIKTVRPEGNSIEYTYDVRSNVLSTTRIPKPSSGLSNIVTSTSYGEAPTVKTCSGLRTCNKPISFIDAKGNVTDYEWDSYYADLLQVKLPEDEDGVRPQINFGYSLFGTSPNEFRRLTSRTEKIGPSNNLVTAYSYDNVYKYVLKDVVVDSGGLELTTTFMFNDFGDVLLVDGPRTDVLDFTTTLWDIHRRLMSKVDPDRDGIGFQLRPATKYTYDLDSQLVQTEFGTATSGVGSNFIAFERTTYDYDAVGNKLRDTVIDVATGDPLAITQYSYDDLDRLDCTAVRMNAAVFGSLPTSACTHSTLGSFGPDRITRSEYDPASQLLKTIRAYGTALQQDYATYTYTDNGQQATVEDANGNLSTFEYDGVDRLAKLRFPDLTSGAGTSSTTDYEEYGYDPNGNRTSWRKRDGSVIGYSYDNLNREIVKDIPGGSVNDVYSGYDLLGRRLYARFASDVGQGITYTYDKPGRLLTETSFGKTLSYQYDPANNRTRITWPDSLYVDYTYDPGNRMVEVRENGATSGPGLLAVYDYDDIGRRTDLTRSNGVTTTWGYDGMSRLTSLVQDPAGSSEDLTVGLSYNPASGIVSRSASNDSYAWTNHSPGTTDYAAANGLNQYTAIDSDPYAYDDNGNLTTGGSRTRAYDVENRLISITGSPNLSLEYDPLGRLLSTTAGAVETDFLYAGDALVGEYNSGGSLTQRYVHGAGIDEPVTHYIGATTASRNWLLADERGSIIATTTAAGTATPEAYGPYGEPNSWASGRFKYTGQIVLPEAQLYHYKARSYDPVLGRFLQTDPVGYEADMHLYAYLSNDPLNDRDPSGACPWCLIGAGISGGVQFTTELISAGSFGNIDAAGWQRVGLSAASGMVGGGVATAVGRLATVSARVAVSATSGGAVGAAQTTASGVLQEVQMPTHGELAASAGLGMGLGFLGAVGAESLRSAGPATLRAAKKASLADQNFVGNINRWTSGSYTPAELEAAHLLRTTGQAGGLIVDAINSGDWTSKNQEERETDEPICAGAIFFSFGCP